jgi:hypothetical protein
MAVGFDGLALTVEPEDRATPSGGLDETQQQSDGGRFSGSIGAQEADHLAFGDFEVQVVKCGDIVVALGQTLGANGGGSHGNLLSSPNCTSV